MSTAPQHTAEHLSSAILTSSADGLLREAIVAAFGMPHAERGEFLARRLREIEDLMAERPLETPWTFSEFVGTDGSRIFRGGIGHSLVVDPHGTIWRARSYEDFATTYAFTGTDCRIATLTPLYAGMRRCEIERERGTTRDN